MNPFVRFPKTSRHLVAAAVAGCFAAAPALACAPINGVASGAACSTQNGNVLTIHTTNAAGTNGSVINWPTFNVPKHTTTHFDQPSASSSVLNRVLLNEPSVILGTLSSNGRVFLINPAGIMVGPGGRVDTAAFVASTLNITNADFLANRMKFGTDGLGGSAGNVTNQGTISTPLGGSVYLIGKNVSNDNGGLITTPKGETILAAGSTVELIDSATPGVKVEITGAAGNATNLGEIVADAGRIGISGVIVRNSGLLNASSVVEDGGRVFLRASKDAYVDGNGRIVATGKTGGRIDVLGDRVTVTDNAELDASGRNGGGYVRVGGDFQGKNPEVPNASETYFGPNARIRVDATEVGDGGTAILWADGATRAYGRISARGGADGGDGGFVEVSGKGSLVYRGSADRRAPKGRAGTLLLDPLDMIIDAATWGYWDGGEGAGIIGDLAMGDVKVQSGQDILITADASYTSASDLYLLATRSIVASGKTVRNFGSGGMTLVANWDGNLGAPDVHGDDNLGAIHAAGSTFQTAGGDLTLKARHNITVGSLITGPDGGEGSVNAGTVYVKSWDGDIDVSSIHAEGANSSSFGAGGHGGDVTLLSVDGTVTYGTIDSSGGDGAEGGNGGSGGNVAITASSIITGGSITAKGGRGGDDSSTSGNGGQGGNVSLTSSIGGVTLLAGSLINANGGDGGDGGEGGSGGSGGNVTVTGADYVNVKAITAVGGNGGYGGSGSFDSGGSGGTGGAVQLSSSAGTVIYGSVDTSGGRGGDGDGGEGAGSGGWAGDVTMTANGVHSLVTGGSITAKGGRGGDDSYGPGSGGGGGDVSLTSTNGGVTLLAGSLINADGGDGGHSLYDYGADGGDGGDVTITAAANIAAVSITARGGRGGDGGDSIFVYGGDGGSGGEVHIESTGGTVSYGSINTSGGRGGDGAEGGDGGYAGNVTVRAVGTITAGSITAKGGAGGDGGEGYGGTGGNAGEVDLETTSGDIAMGSSAMISAVGGLGGEGYSGSGDGGEGGSIFLTTTGANGFINLGYLDAGDGNIEVEATGAILDGNGSGVWNLRARSIDLTSQYGGTASGLAISADVWNEDEDNPMQTLNATVETQYAQYGGVSLRVSGDAPGYVNIQSLADYNNNIHFTASRDIYNDGNLYFTATEGGSIFVSAGRDVHWNSDGEYTFDNTGSVILSAGRNMWINNDMYNGGGSLLTLIAGQTLSIDSSASIDDWDNLLLIAGTLNNEGSLYASNDIGMQAGTIINTGTISAGRDLLFNAGNIYWSADGGEGAGYAGRDIRGDVTGNFFLTDGGFMEAGNDIKLKFRGAASVLSLSDGGYLLAESPRTITLNFTGRSRGGVLIDGVETTSSTEGGSGLFVVNHNTPAGPGAGLELTYAAPAAGNACADNPSLCKRPDDDARPTLPKKFDEPAKDKDEGDQEFGDNEDGKKNDKRAKRKMGQCTRS